MEKIQTIDELKKTLMEISDKNPPSGVEKEGNSDYIWINAITENNIEETANKLEDSVGSAYAQGCYGSGEFYNDCLRVVDIYRENIEMLNKLKLKLIDEYNKNPQVGDGSSSDLDLINAITYENIQETLEKFKDTAMMAYAQECYKSGEFYNNCSRIVSGFINENGPENPITL